MLQILQNIAIYFKKNTETLQKYHNIIIFVNNSENGMYISFIGPYKF